MDYSIRVDPEHFAYLRLQKGALDRWADQRAEWHRRYEADLRQTYEQIAPWLPATCEGLLDVGSGLGGIDVLLARHYAERGQTPFIALLDGVDDEPIMTLHRKTFNHARVARNFQVKNGTSPMALEFWRTDTTDFGRPFDLICSFGSWCFHYPPHEYLWPILNSALKPSTVLILDVRSKKGSWLSDLETAFHLVTTLAVKPKWSRCVFKVRTP